MKKIITSLLVLAAVSTVAVIGTTAFFSDTETSTGNVLQAGAIDLKIDNTSYYNGKTSQSTSWELANLNDGKGPSGDGKYLFFNFNDLKPGDWGEDTISLHVDTNPAWVCANVQLTENDDKSSTEPELEVDVNDNVNDKFDGELAQNVNFVFWADDGDNVLETDEVDNIISQGNTSEVLGLATWKLADSKTNLLTGEDGQPIDGETPYYIGKAWCFGKLTLDPVTQDGDTETSSPLVDPGIACDGSSLNNLTQTDGLKVDFNFTAVQARNNPNYECKDCVVEKEIFAAGYSNVNQGKRKNGSNVLALRSNPNNILGAPDGNGGAGTGFFSLGYGGSIVYNFGYKVLNAEGGDLSFHEITNGRATYPLEVAKVEVSQDGTNWFNAGTVTSQSGVNGVGYVDFSGTGLPWIAYVRLTDQTNPGLNPAADSDGYDLDALDAVKYDSCSPLNRQN